jgi:serine/threonine protein kinase/tetratricopeptide (TPR) repeat protein
MDMDVSESPDFRDRADEEGPGTSHSTSGEDEGTDLARRGLLQSFIRDALVQPGDVIGPYTLLGVLGEGGCGIVYRAEQSQPIRRKVALKVVKPGMDSQRVLARFEAEQQALARMEHPHVARVHDAGLTPRGRPYFVMEYVQGTPITDYCDEHRLTIEERLRLFLHVCEAVQHAHQKGIIHRDLKPSNILVMIEDEEAVPKVIDFGVARAISQPLTEQTLYTEQGQLVGTPEYMSPEQADAGNQDIDTRTDVYSLGVVLYELLAGVLPFDRKVFREGGLEQMRKVIREEEPTTPSTRLSRISSADSAPLAERRGTDVRTLCRRLQGDVDWITLKAMAKDRTQRYESVGELAADLRRHLNHEAVTAVRPSTTYRLRKFVRRNRALVTGLAAVLAVLTGGIVVSMVFAFGQASARKEAEQQARRTQTVVNFLNTDLLGSADPAWTRGRGMTGRYILDAGARRVEGRFDNDPLVEASVRHTLGVMYRRLGLLKDSHKHLERALEVRLSRLGQDHPDALETTEALASLYEDQGQYTEAERLGRILLEAGPRVLGPEHCSTLGFMNTQAMLYYRAERSAEAEPLLARAFETLRRVFGPEDPDTLAVMTNLGTVRTQLGQTEAAEALLTEVMAIKQRVLGREHPETLYAMNNLAIVYANQGRHQEAESLYVKTIEATKRVLGSEHFNTLNPMSGLAQLYMDQGRYQEAELLCRQVLDTRRRTLGEEHPRTLDAMANMALVHRELGRLQEAETLLLKELEIRRRTQGEEDPQTLGLMGEVASLYRRQRRYAESEPLSLKVLEAMRRVRGEEHTNTLAAMNNLANVYSALGRTEEAESLYLKALETKRQVLGEEHPSTLNSANNLGDFYSSQGRFTEAEPILSRTLEARRRIRGERHADTVQSISNMGMLYLRSKRYEQAETPLLRAYQLRQQQLGDPHPDTQSALRRLVRLYEAWGKVDEAAKWRSKLPASK